MYWLQDNYLLMFLLIVPNLNRCIFNMNVIWLGCFIQNIIIKSINKNNDIANYIIDGDTIILSIKKQSI